MDRSTPINLIKSEYVRGENGIQRPQESSRKVFAQVKSVTSSEFFEGGRNGLNPEFRFSIFFGDYQGERIVEHLDKRYAIYRTYQERNDTLELYVERQGGTNGEK